MFPSFIKHCSLSQHLLAWILCFLIPLFLRVECNTECVWATGRIICNKNQSKVLGAIVELWDLDSPQNSKVKNPADPDDKAGFTVVNEESGLFQVEGCASDHDWLPGIVNRPEFYLRVHHECNTQFGEFMTIMPIFRVYTPNTYDYHIQQPIVLDTPTAPRLNGSTAANGIGGVGNFGSTIPNNRSFVELNDAEEDNQD